MAWARAPKSNFEARGSALGIAAHVGFSHYRNYDPYRDRVGSTVPLYETRTTHLMAGLRAYVHIEPIALGLGLRANHDDTTYIDAERTSSRTRTDPVIELFAGVTFARVGASKLVALGTYASWKGPLISEDTWSLMIGVQRTIRAPQRPNSRDQNPPSLRGAPTR